MKEIKSFFIFIATLSLTGCPALESVDITESDSDDISACADRVATLISENIELDSGEESALNSLDDCNASLDALSAEHRALLASLMSAEPAINISKLQLEGLIKQYDRQHSALYTNCFDTCRQLKSCACLKEFFPESYNAYLDTDGGENEQ